MLPYVGSKMSEWQILDIICHTDKRGRLAVVESDLDIPFVIQRVYYLFDVPADQLRGAHAHRALQQLVIAISGSFEVALESARSKDRFLLDRPDAGLYVGPMVWRELTYFTPGAVALVLASLPYDDDDYYHDYDEFRAAVAG